MRIFSLTESGVKPISYSMSAALLSMTELNLHAGSHGRGDTLPRIGGASGPSQGGDGGAGGDTANDPIGDKVKQGLFMSAAWLAGKFGNAMLHPINTAKTLYRTATELPGKIKAFPGKVTEKIQSASGKIAEKINGVLGRTGSAANAVEKGAGKVAPGFENFSTPVEKAAGFNTSKAAYDAERAAEAAAKGAGNVAKDVTKLTGSAGSKGASALNEVGTAVTKSVTGAAPEAATIGETAAKSGFMAKAGVVGRFASRALVVVGAALDVYSTSKELIERTGEVGYQKAGQELADNQLSDLQGKRGRWAQLGVALSPIRAFSAGMAAVRQFAEGQIERADYAPVMTGQETNDMLARVEAKVRANQEARALAGRGSQQMPSTSGIDPRRM